jgi:uncharacterized protein
MQARNRAVSTHAAEPLTLEVDPDCRVSALLLRPPQAKACYVFAHGAGAGMSHPAMTTLAEGLADLGLATLRYQFPYMEKRSRRPDLPHVCHATVRAAVALAAKLAPELPLIAGGRSFGGRMTSQAQAKAPLPGVRGLVFLGFPLHPAKRPSADRAQHLFDVNIPMLFVQGARDELAGIDLLQPVIHKLGERATLQLLQHADHSFHVPARTGRKDSEVRAEALQRMRQWIDSVLPKEPS